MRMRTKILRSIMWLLFGYLTFLIVNKAIRYDFVLKDAIATIGYFILLIAEGFHKYE